jgi:3-dehydroquinate synthase
MNLAERNLVLTGFMGAGKTTVGRGVAQRLKRPFVDMDAVIAERAGRSIPDIFGQLGEGAFRQMERALCEELAACQGLVIATGGGALVDPRNRDVLARSGILICLDCAVPGLLGRLRGSSDRPLLWGEAPERRLSELLAARQSAYSSIPHHVDTTDLNLEAVIATVAARYGGAPVEWRVKTPTGDYPVYLVVAGLDALGPLLREAGIRAQVAVVSDEHVGPLYGERVLEGLRRQGIGATLITLPAGEAHKTLATVARLYDRFVEAGLDRSGAVVALGGGVVTDMAGFAAATYMRGVALVQAPTSLLGMVDASVGGKVAVDHPRGKNLIGAFVQPLLVMLDPLCLDTLPEIERRAGMAEVIKHGVIGDAALFDALERDEAPDMGWLLQRQLQVKIDVVEEDPYERGRRVALNLGHTFAHAYEVLADYDLHHGLAVSMGIATAAHLAELRGVCSAETRERIVSTLARHGLPTRYDAHPAEAVFDAMAMDKKRQGSRLRFILPRAIGEVIVDGDAPRELVLTAIERSRL